ncbi:Na+/H+ exchanger family protein-like protein [Lophiotrema nucula]|uniref:Na+/H+ exchanger family protein-like protein n=1 Tax=Lophiotrema nucula TaxID=690887 RepID=A0A6A5Z6L9_9PLEO|nr:Na+/H+ exchanger family protein-like protein [Lophiotrema nucula]
MAAETASLPYHEPDIVTILVQTSFLLLLNIANSALNRLVYCGLVGQVLIGIAWGSPGGKWLSTSAEHVVVQLGYFGLILLVYEGGLSTSFTSLRANLLLSSAVAVTGICLPIALSFSLQGLLGATPLQAFAAGAALCSTSLGTTFTVLASSDLSTTRLGVVLTSAAMMDDVVGLVMVQVISNLGGENFTGLTVVRPILVSLAFAVCIPLACRFLLKPGTLALNHYRKTHPSARFDRLLRHSHTAFVVHTLLLIGLVAGATYAGTSNLFSAYIAGAVISWWDSELPHHTAGQLPSGSTIAKPVPAEKAGTDERQASDHTAQAPADDVQNANITMPRLSDPKDTETPTVLAEDNCRTSGSAVYEKYYHQAVQRTLQPFFFASIGFSIPISRMFSGSIVWRGLVYAILMTFAKLLCGLWLVRFSLQPARDTVGGVLSRVRVPSVPHFWGKKQPGTNTETAQTQARRTATRNLPASTSTQTSMSLKPISLQPPLILALAMVARGEIGFLISSVAESKGIFSSSLNDGSESDIFLVVTWAIVLCTIVGPLGVGLCVRRVRALENKKNQEREGAGRDVLGVWGVR